MAKDSIHSGHRQRLKNSMLESDFNGLSDINMLEALLFYSIPRGDTNPKAHYLIDTFGSVNGVFEAHYDDLKKVEGIGDNSAFLIKLVNRIAKRVHKMDDKKAVFIRDSNDAANCLRPYFIGERDEIMIAMYLDNMGRLISTEVLGTGVANKVNFDKRKLIEGISRTNAVTIILAHNHPHGAPNPSKEDLDLTQNVRNYIRELGVALYDHLINAGDEWRGIRELKDANLYLSPLPKKTEDNKNKKQKS